MNLAGRSFQIVGPETLNDLGPNVIVLVLGMYSCPDAADCNYNLNIEIASEEFLNIVNKAHILSRESLNIGIEAS